MFSAGADRQIAVHLIDGLDLRQAAQRRGDTRMTALACAVVEDGDRGLTVLSRAGLLLMSRP